MRPAPMAAGILSWARSAIAPKGGAFNALQPHEIAAPVLQALLARANLSADLVGAVVLGNAMGAGGNPARMTALAAGLPQTCAAFSVDSQCCAGLDAVAMGVGLIASGQVDIVVAGGVEAWSRAPIRQTRPLRPTDIPTTFERPAFAPDPAKDPDLLEAASEHAWERQFSRAQQDAYALLSHERALRARQSSQLHELITIAGCGYDMYPRAILPARAARMPVITQSSMDTENRFGLSALTVSAKADGAAMLLLASAQACERLGISAPARWVASASVGEDSRMPMTAAALAAQTVLQRFSLQRDLPPLHPHDMQAIEVHDAFAAQGLSFCEDLGLQPEDINTHGGGLARGHPIGASGAVALVSLLNTLHTMPMNHMQTPHLGLAAIAGAGGLGAACMVQIGNPR
ncbi:thiolase family protein [Diaphorobacter sp. HDW4A]|uniref:thiolase family protein n=1 Tax=Diaphorobacter sp. HDW4A TaxID=2714924 RepID=UPI00140DC5E5|nr:thiolase family protein [Diaphorobacter sp. HDW4A]QIL83840.1 thiolase family protein [Diaphorobacter sp. HDW4A]